MRKCNIQTGYGIWKEGKRFRIQIKENCIKNEGKVSEIQQDFKGRLRGYCYKGHTLHISEINVFMP